MQPDLRSKQGHSRGVTAQGYLARWVESGSRFLPKLEIDPAVCNALSKEVQCPD